MHPPIALSSSRFTAGIAPSLGGSLVWFGTSDDAQHEFVRATPARALHDGNARMSSSYPLVPYSNRIGDGRFTFDGRSIALRTNTSISAHPIHGVGFMRSWTVDSRNERELLISIAHDGLDCTDRDWPWSFEATQRFTLDDDQLVIEIRVVNRDSRPMPAGIGLHPFFTKNALTRVRFAADAMWMSDARMLPASRLEVPASFDFREARDLAHLEVDNCFAGWNGTAELEWPDRGWGLRMRASPVFGHLVVFTSPARDSIAIEPVSHVNNAVNLAASRDDTGLVELLPSQALEGTMTLEPFRIG